MAGGGSPQCGDNMKIFKNEINIDEIKKIISGEIIGAGNAVFNSVAELIEGNKNSICFYENEKYLNDFQSSDAGFIIIPDNTEFSPKENQIYLKTAKPYFSFMSLVSYWLQKEEKYAERTISPQASIHFTANIGKNVSIGPFAVIEENVVISDNTIIGASSVLMKGSKIGSNSKLYPNVVVYEDCEIGNNVIIHSGVVIGADGFGFIPLNGKQIKVPQVGNVVIEDDVEIGANTCIDRATIGTTRIKENVKLDNLVQVAHNCEIDNSSILCAQVGVAGNSFIGKNVYLAGQVGVAGHLTIEDNTLVGAQSGVPSSLKTGTYFGYPALPAFEQKKILASLKDLPVTNRYVKKLIKENKE